MMVPACVGPSQDHLLLPAGLLVLQRVPTVFGLCCSAEGATAAPPLYHLLHPPSWGLSEAALGSTGTLWGPSQHVSKADSTRSPRRKLLTKKTTIQHLLPDHLIGCLTTCLWCVWSETGTLSTVCENKQSFFLRDFHMCHCLQVNR